MTHIDLKFTLPCDISIPSDHGYFLYSGISRIIPGIHNDTSIGIHPIGGKIIDKRILITSRSSRLGIRIPAERIQDFLCLIGNNIKVSTQTLTIGYPQIFPLKPSANLRSRLVTVKGFLEKEAFLDAIQRQMEDLKLSKEITIIVGKQRTIRVKDKEIIGFDLLLNSLTAEESLKIQETGLGGRRRFGCGVFVPYRG